MPGLLDDLGVGHTLFGDILRTASSTALTFGGHALKGLTLGAIDPTEQVAELLGEEVYRAPPAWALKGAELAGELPLIHGAVGAAGRIIPRAGGVAGDIIRRAGVGGLAGVGLGAGRGLAQDDPEWMKHSLMEGLLFGGIEAAFGVPQLLRNVGFSRMARRNQALIEQAGRKAEEAVVSAHTPEALNVAEDMSAYAKAAAGPRPRGMPPEPPRGMAELMSQAEIRDAMFYQHMEPMTQTPAHDLWMRQGRPSQSYVIQTPKGDLDVFFLSAGKVEGKTGQHFILQDAKTGEQIIMPAGGFLRKENVTHRIFRGTLAKHHLPPNMYNELRNARKDLGGLLASLHKKGQIGKDQIREFYKHVHPGAEGINDLADWQVRRMEQLIRRGAEGKGIPSALFDVVGPIGKEVGEAQLGALAYFQPARWVAEGISRKMGGAKWPIQVFEEFGRMGQERRAHKMFLYNRVRNITKGLGPKQLEHIYKIDNAIRKNSKGFMKDKTKFNAIAAKTKAEFLLDAEKKWGAEMAGRVDKAHGSLRRLMNALQYDLAGEGLLEKYRFKPAYWPLLEVEAHPLSDMFPTLPKEIKAFFQHVRKEILDNPETNVLRLLDAYIESYTKLLYTKKAVDNMRTVFKRRKISPGVTSWYNHYSARQYGLPSQWDFRVGESVKRLQQALRLNKLPHFLGGKYFQGFTTKDWVRIGVFFNDLPYYAHLGLRPFSAMRNLLQPMLTTGPMIGNRWLAAGYNASFVQANRRWIAGANQLNQRMLQQSLGEWERRLHLAKTGKDKFANFMMYIFRKSDEINRYASGLGFRAKFDHFWGKIGRPSEEFWTKMKLRRFKESTRTEMRNLGKAYRAQEELLTHKYSEISPRYKELTRDIERWTGREYHHIDNRLPRLKEQMRIKMTQDAIGDTQWLYGKEHAPIFTHAGGVIGRAGGVYQTWWLNYAQWGTNLLRNTFKGGDYMPLATAAANNIMITMGLLAAGWEGSKIFRTIGLGPMPTKLPFMGEMPPGIEPFYRLAESGANLAFKLDPDAAEKRFNIFLKRTWDNWMPGSLVWKEMARVGWAPEMVPYGRRLTPIPTEEVEPVGAKLLSVIGGRGRK